MQSSVALQNAKVTGFKSNLHTSMIYGGSVLWIVFLLSVESVFLVSTMWSEHLDTILIASIVLNSIVLLAQTVDYMYYHFLYWPVTAVNWAAQLAALGTASAFLSVSAIILDGDTDLRRIIGVSHLVAQALFTASQFSVTLEYFERRLGQLTPPPVVPTVPKRRPTSSI